MLGNRSRDTKPELAVRRRLHRIGLRYRVATRPVPTLRRTADIVFSRQRVAIFIDGCFWHGCPEHGQTSTKSNADYWMAKFRDNRVRDQETTRRLTEEGWRVLRFWAHEDPEEVAEIIEAVIRPARRKAQLEHRTT